MTTAESKKLVRAVLDAHGLTNRVTARTVNFTDLARAQPVFVMVHGTMPREVWDELAPIADEHGFILEGG